MKSRIVLGGYKQMKIEKMLGDIYKKTGVIEKAIVNYKNAIEVDGAYY